MTLGAWGEPEVIGKTPDSRLPHKTTRSTFSPENHWFPMICDVAFVQSHESMTGMNSIRLRCILSAVMSAALFIGEVHALSGFPNSQVSANGSTATQADGSHDFDFLIGDWRHMFVDSPNA